MKYTYLAGVKNSVGRAREGSIDFATENLFSLYLLTRFNQPRIVIRRAVLYRFCTAARTRFYLTALLFLRVYLNLIEGKVVRGKYETYSLYNSIFRFSPFGFIPGPSRFLFALLSATQILGIY